MKSFFTRYRVLVIFLLIVSGNTYAQTPDNLGTDVVNGTYTTYTMTNLGKFNQTRLQAILTTPSGTNQWQFYSCSGGCYVNNWRPYTPGQVIPASLYNTDIAPVSGTASALYNSGTGGSPGLLGVVTAGDYYTFNVMFNAAPNNNDMGVLQTAFSPVTITSVKALTGCGGTVTVTATLSTAANTGEYFYLRWSTNSFASSTATQMNPSGSTATATLSGSGTVQFYVFSSPDSALISTGEPDAYYDTQTLNLNNNGGSNYNYTYGTLSGTYTINSAAATSGTNFKLVADAVNELDNRGISGNVVFNVSAGLTETAPAGGYLVQYCSSVAAANQSSSSQTVTFQKSGTGADPLLTAPVGTGASDAIFTLNGTQYITINGIDLQESAANNAAASPSVLMEAGYALLQQSPTVGAQYNTVENCTVTLNNQNVNYSVGILIDHVTYGSYGSVIAASSTATACNNNMVYSNTLLNCSTGIAINLFATNQSIYDQNNIIGASGLGNTIQNFNSVPGPNYFANGINANFQNNISISYNNINNTANGGSASFSSLTGVYVGGNDGTVTINNNTISLAAQVSSPFANSTEFFGIATFGTTSVISNNTIQGLSTTNGFIGNVYVIYNGGPATSLTISGNVIGNSSNPNTIYDALNNIDYIVNQRSCTTVNITGNTIQNTTSVITSGAYAEYIANEASAGTLNITGNTIQNNTVTGVTGTYLWGLVNKSTATTLNFGATGTGNGNTIQNNAFNTTGYIYLFDPTFIGNKSPGTENIINNSILSNTNNTANATSIYMFYNNTATNTVTFSGNAIGNSSAPAYTETAVCTGGFYGYFNYNTNKTGVPSGGTETISNNTFSATLQTSGAVTGFYTKTVTAQTGVVTGNTITNFSNTGTGSFTGFDFELHASNTTTAFNTNVISGTNSLYTTGGGADYGFYVLAPVQKIYSNTFTGMTLSSTSNVNLFPLYIGSTTAATPSSLYSNTISNITTNGTNFVDAIQVSQTVTTCNVYSNTIDAISGSPSQIGAIMLDNTATTTNCYQNNIYNLASTNASAVVTGIDAVAGTTNNVYNNLISNLTASAATSSTTPSIRGLEIDGGTNAGFYFNTVYLNATSSGANFGTAALFLNSTSTALTLENNILANASTANGTQATVALQTIFALAAGTAPATTLYTSTSNNNAFYAPAAGYVYADNAPIASSNNSFQCTCANIAAFQAYITSRESSSFYELPPFTNITATPYNLSLPSGSSTGCYKGGTPVTAITTIDYTGTTRSTTAPTVGAYELTTGSSPDKIAPVINITTPVPSCNSNVTFTATITDVGTGVNTTSGTSPRVYYKLSTENNVLAATNTSASNGWKYAQTASTTSPYSFTINYALLTNAVSSGSIIQYFVVAQDKAATPNVTVSGATLSSCLTSVALVTANFPASSTNSFTVPPFPQNAAITPSSVSLCQGGIQSLTASVSNTSPTPTYAWTPITNLYTDAGTTIAYTTGGNSATVYTNTPASTSYTATITVGSCSTTVVVPITVVSNSWTGNTSQDWNVASNWCANAVPVATTNVVIPGTAAQQPIIGLSGANAVCNNLTIQSGATLTMQSSYTLSLSSGTTFTNSGTFSAGTANETVVFLGTGTVSGTVNFNNVTINNGVNFGTASSVAGNLMINANGFVNTNPVTYGASSTLIYNTNGTYAASTEWKTNAASGVGVPQNVTIGNTSVTQLNFGATTLYHQANGNIIINNGSSLALSTASGGDIYVGGNWTRGSTGTFTNNTRAVSFNGTSSNQTITVTGGGTETFGYLYENKSSTTSLVLGTSTNALVNGGNGATPLKLQNGTLDLNQNTLTFTNYYNSNLNGIGIDGTAGNLTRTVTSSGGTGTFAFTHATAASETATVSRLSANAAILSFSPTVLVSVTCSNGGGTAGVNFGSLLSTINGTLQLNARSFVTGNAPYYGTGSLLQYNASGSYNRTTEWGTASGPGYPYNVQISNNTSLSPGGSANTGITLNTAGNLTIDAGSSFYMDNGGNYMTVPLKVAGNLLINGNLSETNAATVGGDIYVAGNWTFNTGATFIPNSHTVYFNGSLAQSIGGTQGTTFYNLTNTNTTASVSLGNTVTVNNITNLNTGSILTLNGNAINLVGSVTGTGTFTGDNAATMNIKGTVNTSLGTLYFTPGAQLLNTLSVNRWNSTTVANAATLGSSLTTNNLTLAYGVLSTGANLLTLTNPAGLTAPNIPWAAGSTTFGNSYVATCDATGTPISVANNTTPLTGAYGFQINNIGTGGTTTEVYFPVGASFLPAGTSVTAPTPNRMSMKNQGPADNFNVVVNYGDIDNTSNARVSRIWYVNSANSTSTSASDKVTMKLFFVDRSPAGWPTAENEVENTPAPFDFTNIALVERDYSSTDPNFIAISAGTDVKSFPNGTYNNQEVYALYSVGISPDVSGAMNGIYQFNRFSITSPNGIVLPVQVINFKAYQQGSGVQTSWKCLNEVNMDHYEVQRSVDATNFITLGSVTALNNGEPSVNYSFYDQKPLQGDNYYRIKIVGKDGSISYTNVEVVVIGGGLSSINIFPNPVTQHTFTLQLSNIAAGKYSLLIYNTLGQLLLNQEIDHAGGSASQTVYLPAGTARGEYHVRLLGTNLQVEKTLTVQ